MKTVPLEYVAPFTGAWIEIFNGFKWPLASVIVAPFTGAWIEIPVTLDPVSSLPLSHPSRVRGLKFKDSPAGAGNFAVAPFTGAWIEIMTQQQFKDEADSRTLHGCVD